MTRQEQRYFRLALAAGILLPMACGVVLAGLIQAHRQFIGPVTDVGNAAAVFLLAAIVPVSFGSFVGNRVFVPQTFLARYTPLLIPVLFLLVASAFTGAMSGSSLFRPGLRGYAAVGAGMYGLFCLSTALRGRGKPSRERRRGALILLSLLAAAIAGAYGAGA